MGCLPQVWGPSIQSEGQAAGKLGLEVPGSVFLAPSISPPYTPDLGVIEIIHGSEVGNKQGARLGDLEEAVLGGGRSRSTLQHSGPPSRPSPKRGRLRMEFPPCPPRKGGDRGTERGMGNQVAPAPSPSALSSGGSDSDESWAEWGWEGHPLFSHSSQSLVGRVESHRFRM